MAKPLLLLFAVWFLLIAGQYNYQERYGWGFTFVVVASILLGIRDAVIEDEALKKGRRA